MRNMEAVRETGAERPTRREAYLKSFDAQWREIHEGTMPEAGLKVLGRPERKEVCEDVALKSTAHGLFLVADGLSTAGGWLASRETARVMYEALGETLDRGIRNLIDKHQCGSECLRQVSVYVASQMAAAVEQADSRLKTLSPGRDVKTTLSLAKLVTLPTPEGTTHRMFFANVGDSRIYVQQGLGQMRLVTRDDSMLEWHVGRGELTSVQAREIDQAQDPRRIPLELREYARDRVAVTKAVGGGRAAEDLPVSFIDLEPNDRLVLVSDGVSNQLFEHEMQSELDERRADDDNAQEAALAHAAMERSMQGTHPRAKADDIAVVVHTISG